MAVTGRFVAREVSEGAAFQKCSTLTVRVVNVARRSTRNFHAGTAAGAPSDHGCVNSGHPVIELAVRRDGTAAFMVKEATAVDPGGTPGLRGPARDGQATRVARTKPEHLPGIALVGAQQHHLGDGVHHAPGRRPSRTVSGPGRALPKAADCRRSEITQPPGIVSWDADRQPLVTAV